MKNAPDRKAAESAQERRQFSTDNPRHQRVLALLMQRPAKREEIDRAAGASNGPDLIAELRRRGLALPCERVKALDRDGRECRPGIYSVTSKDRRAISAWLRRRSGGFIAPEIAAVLAVVAGPAAVAGVALLHYLGGAL